MAGFAERLQQNPRRQEVARTIVLWALFAGLLAGGLGLAGALAPDLEELLQDDAVVAGPLSARLPEDFDVVESDADAQTGTATIAAFGIGASDASDPGDYSALPRSLTVELLRVEADVTLDSLVRRESLGRGRGDDPVASADPGVVDAARPVAVAGRSGRIVTIEYRLNEYPVAYGVVALAKLDGPFAVRVRMLSLGQYDGEASQLVQAVASSVRVGAP